MNMAPQQRTVLMVGLPSTGKSTYLGAMFNILKDDGTDGMRLEALPEERDYLVEIEHAWLSLKPLARSSLSGPRKVTLSLLLDEPVRSLSLNIPDVVGETYMHAYENGHWADGLHDLVDGASGLLVFIRADTITQPELISIGHPPQMADSSEPQPWQPEYSPTQAIICDLLEQIAALRGEVIPPIAILISAWDAVAEHGLTPDAWLQWQLPLLAQWLQARVPQIGTRVFGVSAQGGELDDDAVRQQLGQDATHRPVPPNGDTIIEPLRWLLERE